MSDIVERLREPDWLTDFEAKLVHDAADEIERLRCALEAITTVEGNIIATDAAKTAEIERLRGLLREGLGEHVRLHVHPHFPAWEKRVREALGE